MQYQLMALSSDQGRVPLLNGDESRSDSKDGVIADRISISVASPGRPLMRFDIGRTETVASLKDRVERERPDHPAERQRIIFSGRELPSSKVLREGPAPVANNSTLHLFLRPEGVAERAPVNEAVAFGGQDDGFVVGNLPMAIEMAAQELMFVRAALQRSAVATRSVSLVFLVFAAVMFVRSGNDSLMLSFGAVLMALSLIGLAASQTRGTCLAAVFYYGLWMYMLFLALGTVVPYVLDNGDSDSDGYVGMLVLFAVLPFFICSPCTFCARQHFQNCTRRDVLLQQYTVVGDPDDDAFMPYDILE